MAASLSDFTNVALTNVPLKDQWPVLARCVQALTAHYQAKIATGTEPSDALAGLYLAIDAQSTTFKDWRFLVNSSNAFLIQENTGSDASPVWVTRFQANAGGSGSGVVPLHAPTHISGGSDPITVTANRVLQSNASTGALEASGITGTTLAFLDATSSIQAQLNARLLLAGGVMSGTLDMDGQRITTTADGTGYIQGPNANTPIQVNSSNGAQFAINVGGFTDFYWTDNGAGAGPRIRLLRTSTTPAAADLLATLEFYGKNSAAGDPIYAQINAAILDPTATSEDASLTLSRMVAGTLTPAMVIGTSTIDARASITFPAGGAPVNSGVIGIGSGGFSLTTNVPSGGYTTEFRNGGTVIAEVNSNGMTLTSKTATTVPYIDANKALQSSAVTPTELGYLSGVTSALQTQLNNRPVLLATYSPSAAASVDVTSVFSSTYSVYLITVQLVPATDDVELRMRTDTSNGASFDSGAGEYDTICRTLDTAGVANNNATDAQTSMIVGSATATKAVGNATGEFISGAFQVYTGSAARFASVTGVGSYMAATGILVDWAYSGARTSAATINAIQFFFESGNIASGTVKVYGLP